MVTSLGDLLAQLERDEAGNVIVPVDVMEKVNKRVTSGNATLYAKRGRIAGQVLRSRYPAEYDKIHAHVSEKVKVGDEVFEAKDVPATVK